MPNNPREVSNSEITKYLYDLFNIASDELRVRWAVYNKDEGGKGKELVVYEDFQEQQPVADKPTVEIDYKTTTNGIFSIGTQEEIFNYDIIVSVMKNHPTESKKYLEVVSHSLMEYLNQLNRRSFRVPGKDFCMYYSEANNIDYKYRRGKGLLSARFSWFCKLLKIGYVK